jgi:hypothetical protein
MAIDYVITYRKGSSTKLIGYSDTSYADDPDSQKSMARQSFMMEKQNMWPFTRLGGKQSG